MAPQEDAEATHWREFGQWLRAARTANGFDIKEAAQRAGISPSAWQNFENGGRTNRGRWEPAAPKDVTLVNIARALQIDTGVAFHAAGRDYPDVIAVANSGTLEERVVVIEAKVDSVEAKIDQLRAQLGAAMELLREMT